MSAIKLGTQKQKMDKTTSSAQMSVAKLKEVIEKNQSNKIKGKARVALDQRLKTLKKQAKNIKKIKSLKS